MGTVLKRLVLIALLSPMVAMALSLANAGPLLGTRIHKPARLIISELEINTNTRTWIVRVVGWK